MMDTILTVLNRAYCGYDLLTDLRGVRLPRYHGIHRKKNKFDLVSKSSRQDPNEYSQGHVGLDSSNPGPQNGFDQWIPHFDKVLRRIDQRH